MQVSNVKQWVKPEMTRIGRIADIGLGALGGSTQTNGCGGGPACRS